MTALRLAILPVLFTMLGLAPASAQDNYEIQVYGGETVPPGTTLVELHSNFTAKGSKTKVGGLEPTHHAEHETIEITQGITTGSKLAFTSSPPSSRKAVGNGSATISVLGSRFPRLGTGRWGSACRRSSVTRGASFLPIPGPGKSVPSSIRKSGAGISPSIPRSIARFTGRVFIAAWSFHPTPRPALISHDTSLAVWSTTAPTVRSPALIPWLIRGSNFSRPSTWIWGPQWEFNFGVGIGATRSTDHLIIKCILGRRFSWKRNRGSASAGAIGATRSVPDSVARAAARGL